MGIIKQDGTHSCVERTMDGYYLMDEFVKLLQSEDFENDVLKLLETAEFGTSSIQRGEEREHDQEYFVLIDFKHKVIMTHMVFDLEGMKSIVSFCEKHGYNWETGYDCLDNEYIRDNNLCTHPYY